MNQCLTIAFEFHFFLKQLCTRNAKQILTLITLHHITSGPLSIEVQQRGIGATRAILEKLLEGLPLGELHPVLLVDCMPNRLLSSVSNIKITEPTAKKSPKFSNAYIHVYIV